VDSNRFLSDRVIQGLLEREAVIGVVPYNRFLLPGWRKNDGRQVVSLDRLVSQIDHICQMAGDAQHVGIGSDFDGGFGLQSVPAEINTVADLKKLVPLLAQKGYTEDDIAAVLGRNWLTVLKENLPKSI
jgi:membrane dipeptidase